MGLSGIGGSKVMETVFIYGVLLFVTAALVIQSVMFYRMYSSNLKKEQPKLDTESKEWIAFVDLFKDNKIHEGYIVSYFDKTEEFMLHFIGFGTSHGYHKDKFLLGDVWFECDGICGYDGDEEEYGRVASYDLNIDNIIGITPIEEYFGRYGDTDNEHYVTCTLKNGNKVEIIFNYKDEK